MNYIRSYENFVLENYYQWIDSQLLLISESTTTDKIRDFLIKTFKKIANLSIERKKSILIYALTSLLLFTNSEKVLQVVETEPFIKNQIIETPELGQIIKNNISQFKEDSPFKDATTLSLSKDGLDQIKAEEGDPKNPGKPVLKAYKLGDGRITIGWGHAEKARKSQFRKGQTITQEKAEELLKSDVKVAEEGVRRIFNQWKEKGLERKITQDQFDALVSIAFNIGVNALRQSDVIKLIKKGDYKSAGKSIREESLSKKFPGLENRRERESDLFLSYVDEISDKTKI